MVPLGAGHEEAEEEEGTEEATQGLFCLPLLLMLTLHLASAYFALC